MRGTARRRQGTIAAVAVAVLVLVTGCAKKETPAAAGPATTRAPLPVDFSLPGPYKVGTMTLDIGGRNAVVYYPADVAPPLDPQHVLGYDSATALPDDLRAGVPAQALPTVALDVYQDPKANPEGPYPIVLHSHGEGSYYLFESRHFEQLASWGFVVAAPDHQERALASTLLPPPEVPPPADQDVTDLRDTWQALRRADVQPGGPLLGAMNLDLLAVEGNSLGAKTAVEFAADPAVKTFVAQAPGALIDVAAASAAATPDAPAAVTPPAKPSLVITGDRDQAVPVDGVHAVFDWLQPPKTLTVLKGAGHNAFSDLCPPIRAKGGLTQYDPNASLASASLLRFQDGCLPSNLDPERGYALINQVTIAQLRWVFGIDADRASLDPSFLQQTFGDALASIDYVGT